MISKRSMGCELREVPLAKRFRQNLADALLANELSARRVGSLASDAALAGAAHVQDIADRGTQEGRNASRDLLRRLLKGNQWPDLYFAPITVLSPLTGADEQHDLAMMLPHEVIEVVCRLNQDRSKTHAREAMDVKDLAHLRHVEGQTSVPAGTFVCASTSLKCTRSLTSIASRAWVFDRSRLSVQTTSITSCGSSMARSCCSSSPVKGFRAVIGAK